MLDRATFIGGLVAAVTTNAAADFAAHNPIRVSTNKHIIWKLRVLDGPDFQLADHRGSVVVANFFATWCSACALEGSDLIAFANAHLDDTIVVGIDVDEEDNVVRAWRKKFAVPYRIAMDENSRYLRAIAGLENVPIPLTLVFDPNGFLSSWWYDSASRQQFEDARNKALAAVTGADATPAPSPSPPG